MNIKYYSRPGCGLCEEGIELLKLVQEDVSFTIEEINIETDDSLHEQFMLMIPVVEKNGEIVQYGALDYVTLLEGLAIEEG
ncbi:glutaredoxin family protein [Viridibacillus sp. NPDC093762]|uniref:glutaredoxin family protein n=1 Tax=Viridibacillus sp. NPDC093762 TaxID=3390720 RepID=UPI003D011F39